VARGKLPGWREDFIDTQDTVESRKEGQTAGTAERGVSSVAARPFARSARSSSPVTSLGTHTQQLRAPSKTCACGGAHFNFNLEPTPDPPTHRNPTRTPPNPQIRQTAPPQSDWPHGNLLFSTLRQCPTGDGVLCPRVIVLLCFLVPSSNLRVRPPPVFP